MLPYCFYYWLNLGDVLGFLISISVSFTAFNNPLRLAFTTWVLLQTLNNSCTNKPLTSYFLWNYRLDLNCPFGYWFGKGGLRWIIMVPATWLSFNLNQATKTRFNNERSFWPCVISQCMCHCSFQDRFHWYKSSKSSASITVRLLSSSVCKFSPKGNKNWMVRIRRISMSM